MVTNDNRNCDERNAVIMIDKARHVRVSSAHHSCEIRVLFFVCCKCIVGTFACANCVRLFICNFTCVCVRAGPRYPFYCTFPSGLPERARLLTQIRNTHTAIFCVRLEIGTARKQKPSERCKFDLRTPAHNDDNNLNT